jgi:hypothetical protein
MEPYYRHGRNYSQDELIYCTSQQRFPPLALPAPGRLNPTGYWEHDAGLCAACHDRVGRRGGLFWEEDEVREANDQ